MSIRTLAKRVSRIAALVEQGSTPELPGLHLYRATEPTQVDAMIYEPIVCLIVQGSKQTTIGEETATLAEGDCIVVGHDLPVLARIAEASGSRPYLSLVIRLDLGLLRTLDESLYDAGTLVTDAPRSLEVARACDPMLDVLERYVALAEDPTDTKVLLPLVHKELHYRLLRSEPGAMLRALVNHDSQASSIGRAIGQLRANYRVILDVPELARSVGMSTSSFHRHFKSMTRTTPLQFQKDLRLTEARRLLRSGEQTVSSAAFEVGYQSPSQFSREYARKFGAPPRADLQVA